MDPSIVHDVHMTINLVHRFVYFVPEAAEEYAKLGVTGRGSYFASRAAPMGPVPDEMVLATFYNFHPRAVHRAMAGMWAAAAPATWQAARFRAAQRALERVGAHLSAAVLREWRGDVHIALLVANEVGPCDCMVLQVGTGRFPLDMAQASRQWDEDEWDAAISRLGARGWVGADGAMTANGTLERERIEADTDRLCAPIWEGVGNAAAARLGELISPIHAAMQAAGTYGPPA